MNLNPEQIRHRQRLEENARLAIATHGGNGGRLSSFGLPIDPASQLAMVLSRPAQALSLSNILADDNHLVRAMHAVIGGMQAHGRNCFFCFKMRTSSGGIGHHPGADAHNTKDCRCSRNSYGPNYRPRTAAHAGYGAPPAGYAMTLAGYGAPHPGYVAHPAAYGAPLPAYGAPLPAYGAPHPAYGAPRPAYGAPPPAYGAPPPAYGAPHPAAAPVMHHHAAVAALPLCPHGQLGCVNTDFQHWRDNQHR